MRIVFTGGTSFSGLWFVQELVRSGHEVLAPLRQKKEAYSGLRKARLHVLEQYAETIEEAPFGSDRFLNALAPVDLLCHHAAEVTNYKSPDFNITAALENNTHRLQRVLGALKCHTVILTGSVFEPGEGEGSDQQRAVSPYGLSKGLTAAYVQYYVEKEGMRFKKFVIPNPFGPYEEVRFTTFLIQQWLKGHKAPVAMPAYVRDNIPITLLAKAYADFVVKDLPKLNPSGYVESQGDFTLRFQGEMRKRLHLPCEVDFKEQLEFPEPKVRINVDKLSLEWDEKAFWDELAEFYLRTYEVDRHCHINP